MADRPYRNALDLSVLHMKPQMVKARLADSSKVHNCACSPLAMSTLNTSETGNLSLSLSLSLSRHGCHKPTGMHRFARYTPAGTADADENFIWRKQRFKQLVRGETLCCLRLLSVRASKHMSPAAHQRCSHKDSRSALHKLAVAVQSWRHLQRR
jgi:hypothetical protein